jgi:hypothetical protein
MFVILFVIVAAQPRESEAQASWFARVETELAEQQYCIATESAGDDFKLDLAGAFDRDLLFQVESDPPELALDEQAASAPDKDNAPPFGTPDTSYWSINFGGGIDFDERTAGRVGLGTGYFIAENVSLDVDLALCYFDQPGDNAYGINGSLLLRWHFITDDEYKWSLYGETGAGLMGTTDDVPANGTSFNFTPQLGFGATFDIGERRRLFTGIRWFHVSNANTFEDNPAVDFAMIHATIAFPF